MKPLTARTRKPTSTSQNQKHDRNSSADTGKRCSCCQGKQHYPNYLAELRKKRLQKQRKRALAQSLLQLQSSTQVKDQKIFQKQHKELLESLTHQISDYEETPTKSGMLESLHQAIILSSLKGDKKKEGESLKKLLKSGENEEKLDEMKSDEFLFEIGVEIDGQEYSRNFLGIEFGAAAIMEIEHILRTPVLENCYQKS